MDFFVFSLLLKVAETNKTSYMLFHYFFLVEKLYLSLPMYAESLFAMCRW